MVAKTKIIFLDVDGVLNSYQTVVSGEVPKVHGYVTFAPSLIAKLAQVVKATEAKVVLTSTWRMFRHRNEEMYLHLKNTLKEQGIEIIDTTGESKEDIRGLEIQTWLMPRKSRNIQFVIIDDEYRDIEPYYPNELVKVNSEFGLSDKNVIQAIEILNKES